MAFVSSNVDGAALFLSQSAVAMGLLNGVDGVGVTRCQYISVIAEELRSRTKSTDKNRLAGPGAVTSRLYRPAAATRNQNCGQCHCIMIHDPWL
ncbi:hypothetical protein M378DRAFT_161445 [Amanita muscaria Koide BX008]|uniref:Uncharacterized protein n=1 Tax=Amanita muscaria (strain Koide BX008) TaxID=946122 RepID=A0A0C2TGW9_AMAMK|nr:hypothetical protein M378DRAFT_161445 [Amanita muscaria Koide BX008]